MIQIQEFFEGAFPVMKEIDEGYFGKAEAIELSSPTGQSLFKEYAYFLIEEVGEIYDTKENVPLSAAPTLDEIADVIGFLHVLVLKGGATPDIYDREMAFKPYIKTILGHPLIPAVYDGEEIEVPEIPALADRQVPVYPLTGEGDEIRWRGTTGFHALTNAEVRALLFQPIFDLTMTCNILKNRKWKNENYPLDRASFDKQLKKTYNSFISAIFQLGYTLKDIKAAFEKKTGTNLKRIKENY